MLLSFICVHNTELVSWQFESLFLNYKLMDVCKLDVSSHLPPCFFQTARLPHPQRSSCLLWTSPGPPRTLSVLAFWGNKMFQAQLIHFLPQRCNQPFL